MTAKEIAIKYGLYHSFTKEPNEMAIKAMKEYATQIAKKALEDAANNARIIKEKESLTEETIRVQVNKQSILNTEINLP